MNLNCSYQNCQFPGYNKKTIFWSLWPHAYEPEYQDWIYFFDNAEQLKSNGKNKSWEFDKAAATTILIHRNTVKNWNER